MATNEVYDAGSPLSLPVSHPTTPSSNDPVRVGEMVGVAVTDERPDGNTTITFEGVHDLSVKAINGGGNSAVAIGDRLYYVDADTPPISKKDTGRPVGFAVEAITSGSTDTIRVRLDRF